MNSSVDEDDPFEIIADEFVSSLRSGKAKSIAYYEKQFPQHADQIRALFPTLLLMEKGKPRPKDPTPSSGFDPLQENNIRHLGDFEILHRVGHGGMGIVYEAIQKSLGRRVALKVLSPSMFATEDSVARFQREARAAANLHHPHIVPIYNIGSEAEIHYYAMQYIDGFGIDEIIASHRENDSSIEKDDPALAARLESLRHQSDRLRGNWTAIAESVRQIAFALAYAHSQNTWHRDIKPSNLLVDQNGKPWIADFGLAKLTNHVDNLSSPQQTMGTLRYMPVEQIEGEEDHRSDIYSLGLTLYELLTWQPAFSQSNRSQLIKNISSGLGKSPRQLNPQIPRDLETITLKATSSEPTSRYQTAMDLAADLRRFLEDRPIMARRMMFHEKVIRLMRRNPVAATLTTIIAILVLTVAIVSTIGYTKVQSALTEKEKEHSRAQAFNDVASGALESIFTRFSAGTNNEIGIRDEPVLSRDAADMIAGLLPFYEQLARQDSDDDEVRIKAADAQFHVAMIHRRLGNLKEAIFAFESSVDKFSRLSFTNAETMLSAIRAKNEMAVVYRLVGRGEEAAQEYAQSIQMIENLLNSPELRKSLNKANLQFELAKTYYLMSRRDRIGVGPSSLPPFESTYFLRYESENSQDESLEKTASRAQHNLDLDKAISLLENLDGSKSTNAKIQHLLAICLRERASDTISDRTVGEMEDELRATTMLETLVATHPKALPYRIDLAQTYAELSVFGDSIAPDQLSFALDQLQKAIKLYDELLIDRAADTNLVASAIHCYFKMAMVLSRQSHHLGGPDQRENMQQAEQFLRKATERQEALVKLNPEALGYRVWLSKFQLHLALTTFRRFGENDAQEAINSAIGNIENLSPGDIAESRIVKDQLAACYVMLRRILHAKQLDDLELVAITYGEELLTELGIDTKRADDLFRRGPPPRGP